MLKGDNILDYIVITSFYNAEVCAIKLKIGKHAGRILKAHVVLYDNRVRQEMF